MVVHRDSGHLSLTFIYPWYQPSTLYKIFTVTSAIAHQYQSKRCHSIYLLIYIKCMCNSQLNISSAVAATVVIVIHKVRQARFVQKVKLIHNKQKVTYSFLSNQCQVHLRLYGYLLKRFYLRAAGRRLLHGCILSSRILIRCVVQSQAAECHESRI